MPGSWSSAKPFERPNMKRQTMTIHTDGDASATPADRLLADVRRIAPRIVARAAEIEMARRIPADLVEELKSIGIFRLFVPRSHGGFELDLPAGLEVIAALSRIDGSVGWTVAIASVGS